MAKRLLWICALILLAGGAVLAILSVGDATAVRADLERARAALSQAGGATGDLDIDALGRALGKATQPIERASSRAHSLSLRVAGRIPILGRSARTVAALTQAAELALQAGRLGLSAAKSFPTKQGKIDYAIANGRIDLAPWTQARPQLRKAAALLRSALKRVSKASGTWTLHSIESSRRKIEERLTSLERVARASADASDLVPRMFGDSGAKQYLLAFQNSAEARATGGLVGGFAIIRAQGGSLHLQAVESDVALVRAKTPVPMPDWYRARYDRFDARRLWSSVNLEPDFRVTGPLIADLFAATVGPKVDGVIATDPIGLQELLRVTGPVQGPNGTTLEASSIARLVMSDSYRNLSRPDQTVVRKQFFVAAAERIWARLLQGGNLRGAVQALGRAAAGRHVMIWSSDPAAEKALASLEIDGGFRPATSFARVMTQNASGSKIDYYLRRSISVAARLQPDGSADFRLQLVLRNTAPKSGLPQPVAGPDASYPKDPPGMNRTYLSVHLPATAQAGLMTVGGSRVEYTADDSPDARIVSRFVSIPPMSSLDVVLEWTQPHATEGCGRARTFAFTFDGQPTVAPDEVRVDATAPNGFRLVGLSREVTIRSDRASLRTVSKGSRGLEIALTRPLWRRLGDALALHRPPACRSP